MTTRNLEHDVDALTRTISELRSEIGSMAGSLAGRAGGAAQDAGRWGARRVGHAAEAAAGEIQGQVADRPLTALGLAFAAGLAIGRFLVR